MKIKGKVVRVGQAETVKWNKGEFKKRDVVLEYGDKYPKNVFLTLSGKAVEVQVNIGDEVECDCIVESRESKGRWFTSVKAWGVSTTKNTNTQHVNTNFRPTTKYAAQEDIGF